MKIIKVSYHIKFENGTRLGCPTDEFDLHNQFKSEYSTNQSEIPWLDEGKTKIGSGPGTEVWFYMVPPARVEEVKEALSKLPEVKSFEVL
ncbi:MAG: hypothetical protein LC778_19765 [Acidobacteria bacterium]|nr:hypothetical protein [Acidobacteriota bacterium]